MLEKLIAWEYQGKLVAQTFKCITETHERLIFTPPKDHQFQVGQNISVTDISEFDKLSALDFIESKAIGGEIVKIKSTEIEVKLFQTNLQINDNDELMRLQKYIPQSSEFLFNYNKEKAYEILEKSEQCTLHTFVGGTTLTYTDQFTISKSGSIILKIQSDHIITNHLNYTNQGVIGITLNEVKYYFDVFLNSTTHNDYLSLICWPKKFTYENQTRLDTYYFPTLKPPLNQILEQTKNSVNYWFKAIRGLFTLVAITPAIITYGYLLRENALKNHFSTILVLLGIMCFQIGASFLNDYFDHLSKVDEYTFSKATLLSSPKFVQNSLLSPYRALSLSIYFVVVGAIIGLYLNFTTKGNVVLILGILGIFLSYFYSAKPVKLAYRGGGELILAILYGPIVMIGTNWVLTESFENPEFINIGYMMVITVGLVLIINLHTSLPDLEIDKLSQKKTTAVRLGVNGVKYVIATLFHGMYLYFILLWIYDKITPFGLLIFLTYPLSMFYVIKYNKMNSRGLLKFLEIILIIVYFSWMILLIFSF